MLSARYELRNVHAALRITHTPLSQSFGTSKLTHGSHAHSRKRFSPTAGVVCGLPSNGPNDFISRPPVPPSPLMRVSRSVAFTPRSTCAR